MRVCTIRGFLAVRIEKRFNVIADHCAAVQEHHVAVLLRSCQFMIYQMFFFGKSLTSASLFTASTNAGVIADVDSVSKVPRRFSTISDGMPFTKEEKLCVRTLGSNVRGMMSSNGAKLFPAVGPS